MTQIETIERVIENCRLNKDVLNWRQEPYWRDFFQLFCEATRDGNGVPTFDGHAIMDRAKDRMGSDEFQKMEAQMRELCKSWDDWRYAIENWQG
jgi:hypothetical protein